MQLIQDPFPKQAAGEKGPATSEVSSRASQLPFPSRPWYITESDSKAFETLKSHIYSSLFVPCRSILSQETVEMKSSRNVKSIKQRLCGTRGRRGSRGGWCSEGEREQQRSFTPKSDGLFANKGEGLGLLSSSDFRLQWIRPTSSVL